MDNIYRGAFYYKMGNSYHGASHKGVTATVKSITMGKLFRRANHKPDSYQRAYHKVGNSYH
jgi:hypothetical protein